MQVNFNIETIEIVGLASVLRALRLPFGKEMRSECNVAMSINEDYQPPMFQYGFDLEVLHLHQL